jgi:CubicO group peptidase (beta-lactamase class C family)
MTMRRLFRGLLLAPLVCLAAAHAQAPSGDLRSAQTERIEAAARTFMKDTGIANMSFLLMRGETVLMRRDYGAYDETTVLPLASATKWVTGAMIMRSVDRGELSLDASIGTYVSGLPGTHAGLRVRELLSYTAGLPSLADGGGDIAQNKRIAMDEAVRALASRPPSTPPSTNFAYGGPDFQFLGAALEAKTGSKWASVFDEAFARPMGLSPFYWSNPKGPNPPNTVTNPLLQGGAATTLTAYGRFLTMIAGKGVFEGRRYLSEAAIRRMEESATDGLTLRYVPEGAPDGAAYNLAHWCERPAPSGCLMLSSPGAFGVYPWIDRPNGLHGVIFVEDRLARIADEARAFRDEMIASARLDAQ